MEWNGMEWNGMEVYANVHAFNVHVFMGIGTSLPVINQPAARRWVSDFLCRGSWVAAWELGIRTTRVTRY